MSEGNRSTAYRAALDSAYSELDQMMERMAQLRNRRGQLEKALDALKPVVDAAIHVVPSEPQQTVVATERPQETVESNIYQFQQVQEAAARTAHPVVEDANDPLQKHINHALGMLAAV
jgi:hypothetical protein